MPGSAEEDCVLQERELFGSKLLLTFIFRMKRASRRQ